MAASNGNQNLELPRLPNGQHIRLFHLSVHEKKAMSAWEADSEAYYIEATPENDSIELFITHYEDDDEDGLQKLTIKLEIACYSLDSLPSYHALSYRWGPAIYNPLPGTHLSNGLLECLPFLACEMPGHWWVDAICIDQDNEEEKIEQIKAMANTFTRAQGVVAYIGPHTDSSFEAIELAHDTYDRFATKELIFNGANSTIPEPQNDTLRMLNLPGREDSAWLGLYRLRHRPYFTRVWMIQEILLAQEVRLLCGTTMIPWTILECVSIWMTSTGLLASMASLALQRNLPRGRMPLLEIVPVVRNKRKQLTQIVTWARCLAATDPKDKIIGVMGLLDKSDPIKPFIESIYRLPTPEFYALTTKAMIAQDKSLAALQWVDGGLRALPGLPSWVPDYSFTEPVAASDGIMAATPGADGGLIFEMEPSDTWAEFTLQTKMLDEVVKVSKSADELGGVPQFALQSFLMVSVYADIPLQYFLLVMIGPGDWQCPDDCLLEYRPFGSLRSEPLVSKRDININGHVIKSVPCSTPDMPDIARLHRGHTLYNQLWRTLIKDGLVRKDLALEHDRFHFVIYILYGLSQIVPELIHQCGMLIPKDWILPRDDFESLYHAVQFYLEANFYNFVDKHVWTAANRRFFITKMGRLGVGSLATDEGSIIAIGRGANTCLVLDGSNTSILQGIAHVHGLMNGEGLQTNIPWEKLVLR